MSVCDLTSKTKSKMKNISEIISQKISTVSDTATETVNNIINVKSKIKSSIKNAKDDYLNQSWRTRRPDVAMIVEIFVVAFFIIILFAVWPYFTGTGKLPFSRRLLEQAGDMPSGQLSVKDVARVNLETRAIDQHRAFFDRNPFSPQNSGQVDLERANAVLPILQFTVEYVVPPLVIAYVIWFIVKYWPYVIAALWGWFLMLYNYFSTLIECKLGCKWYIRMVTGWDCCSPDFGTYFDEWRRKYIDQPMYYERLKYVKKYHIAKRKYYEIPYRKYIELPYMRTKIKAEYARRLYIDRAINVLLGKLEGYYLHYYTLPKKDFFRWLTGNHKNLAAVYAKVQQANAQIQGDEYPSVDKNGKMCMCPAKPTAVKQIKKVIQKHTENVSEDVNKLVKTTHELYDKINSGITNVNLAETACSTVDNTISNRQKIAGTVLIATIVIVLSLFLYSNIYGVPKWLDSIVAPKFMYVTRGSQLRYVGKNYFNWFWIYLGSFLTLLLMITFS